MHASSFVIVIHVIIWIEKKERKEVFVFSVKRSLGDGQRKKKLLLFLTDNIMHK
jgi:hypothetical protein